MIIPKKQMDEVSISRQNSKQCTQYLMFRTDNRLFAIVASELEEIVIFKERLELPEYPAYMTGIIALRGNAIPLIDLRIKFGQEFHPYTQRTCILVVRYEESLIGIVVDGVDKIGCLDDNVVIPLIELKKEYQNMFGVSGVARKDSQLVLILDTSSLIVPDELPTEDELNAGLSKLSLTNK